MDIESIIDAGIVSAFIVIGIVVGAAAIVYCFIKKKKNYDSKGVPELVDDKSEKEGSTKK